MATKDALTALYTNAFDRESPFGAVLKMADVKMGELKDCSCASSEATLYVVAAISNPARFKRRYELFVQFMKRLEASVGVQLYVAELAYGNLPFEVTHAGNPRHLQLRTEGPPIWQKEALLNLAVQRLPADWKYVAWIDGDVEFMNKNWVQDTLVALQSYSVVQMFQNYVDLGPDGEVIQLHTGFGYLYTTGDLKVNVKDAEPYYGQFGHSGIAWACTRAAWNGFGGLPTFGIAGNGDHALACALIGLVDKSYPKGLVHTNFVSLCNALEKRCEFHIRRNIGYVKGTIMHYWHGRKRNRFYQERWQIIISNDYDPLNDLFTESTGVLALQPYKPKLRDDLRRYFHSRCEDSIDVE